MSGDQWLGVGLLAAFGSLLLWVAYGLWTREGWRPWNDRPKQETPEQRDSVLWLHLFHDVKREHPELGIIKQREEAQRRFERIVIQRAQEFAELRDK